MIVWHRSAELLLRTVWQSATMELGVDDLYGDIDERFESTVAQEVRQNRAAMSLCGLPL